MNIPLDIHTHTPDRPDAVLNIEPHESIPTTGLFSIGFHPWRIPSDWSQQLPILKQKAQNPRCWAIGECGLDKLSSVPMPLQIDVFKAHIALAEQLEKPLIIHCVRSLDTLIPLIRNTSAHCIIHGFRGKPQQARTLLALGCSLSFGERFNSESLALCPPDRLFTETDESSLTIEEIRARIGVE